jgi:hypothetical protein
MDISSKAGGAGNFSFHDSRGSIPPVSTGRSRVRSADFGLPERTGLLDPARTCLEPQTRLWPELAGTAAVPAAAPDAITAVADGDARRFRQQVAEAFRPAGTPRVWSDLGVAYLRFSDENSNPRSLDQQLLIVITRARRDGVFIPWPYVLADTAVSGTLACPQGYAIAKTLMERRSETGVAWSLIDELSRISRNMIESLRVGELTAETDVRLVGASDGFDSANPQSVILLPVLGIMSEAFITQLKAQVRRCMDDASIRGDNIQPPGVGHRLAEVRDAAGNLVITRKGTIEKAIEIDPEAADWTRRGAEMIAYEGFIADVTAEVNTRPAQLARQPIPSSKKLEQEIANENRQLKRLTDRLEKVDGTHLHAVIAKAQEMGRQLAAKRERLKALQRAARRPARSGSRSRMSLRR